MKQDATDLKLYELLYTGEKKRAALLTAFDNRRSALNRKLAKAIKRNFVSSPKHGVYVLTEEGKKIVAANRTSTVPPDLEDPIIKGLIALFPTAEHQALFRLVLSLAVGKGLLLPYFDRGWPNFVMFGATRTLKTTLAEVVCHLLGLDPNIYIFHASHASPKELGIRHLRKGEGFEATLSIYYQAPFMACDEVDKTSDNKVKKTVFSFLDDRASFPSEGTPVTKKCTALLALNLEGGIEGLNGFGLHPEHLRRLVALYTTPLVPRIGDPTVAARKLKDYVRGQKDLKLDLSGLKPNQTALTDEQSDLISRLISAGIKPEYQSLVDSYSMGIATLCRACLLKKGTPMEEVIFATASDYFTCADTLGLTNPDWQGIVLAAKNNPAALTKVIPQSGVVLPSAVDPAAEAKQAGNVQPTAKPVSTKSVLPERTEIQNMRFISEKRRMKTNAEQLLKDLPQKLETTQIIADLKDFLVKIEEAKDETFLKELDSYFLQDIKPSAGLLLRKEELRKAKEALHQEIMLNKKELNQFLIKIHSLDSKTLIQELEQLRCGKSEGPGSFRDFYQQPYFFWPNYIHLNRVAATHIVKSKLDLLDKIEKEIIGGTNEQLIFLSLLEIEERIFRAVKT